MLASGATTEIAAPDTGFSYTIQDKIVASQVRVATKLHSLIEANPPGETTRSPHRT